MSRITISPLAQADLQAITDHYLREGGLPLATRFLNAWDSWEGHISAFSDAGSPRLARELGIPGLRIWPVNGFPYLGFYRAAEGRVIVTRVLHSARDIPASFRD